MLTDKRTASVLLVFICSLCFGLFFGLNYGISNQNTYLIHGLNLFNPDLLANDWLTSETTDYNPFFSYLVMLLYSLNSGGWAFGIINVISLMLGSILIYKIMAVVLKDRFLLPVYLLLMAIITITKTFSVSGSYIFCGILQPSTIGSLGFLAAFLYFIRKQYALSGIYLALGGIFHANFLVLGFPVFFIAHLLIGRHKLGIRLLKQLGFSVISLMPLMPLIISSAGSPDSEIARRILFEIRSPHHYMPSHFYKDFVEFSGWLLMGLAIGWKLFLRKSEWLNFKILLISMLFLTIIATLLTSVVYIPLAAQLYFWRLAPFVILFIQIIISAGCIMYLMESQSAQAISKTALASITAGFGLVNLFYVHHGKYQFLLILLLSIMFKLILRLKSYKQFSDKILINIVLIFSLAVWVIGGLMPLKDAPKWSSLISGFSINETELYNWASHTKVDAVFLVPPDLNNFRLNAQRAIVVDWKSHPILSSELIAWYHRIETVSGIEKVSCLPEAAAGYNNIDDERLTMLRAEYQPNYIVLHKGYGYDFSDDYELVFENDGFVVLKLK